jgi:hypothetical protein
MRLKESDYQFPVDCSCCGLPVTPGLDRTFALAEDRALCFECSVERGGKYDETRGCWVQAPRTDGLVLQETAPREVTP